MAASPWKRILAFALDYLVIAAYLALLTGLTWAAAHTPAGPWLAALFADPLPAQLTIVATLTLPVVLYFALLESFPSQATWGKRRMRLQVVGSDGGRLGRGRALVRSLVKFVPWELAHTCLWRVPGWPLAPQEPPWPVYVGFAVVWLLVLVYLAGLFLGEKRQTLYDRLAGARVMDREVFIHPLYGEIPLIRKHYLYPDGSVSEWSWREVDATFRPKVPTGAIEGDVSQQEFCWEHNVPRYFYVHEHKVCVQCGRPFVFSAREQKYWFEVLKFNYHSTAIRCLQCRRERRRDRPLRRQFGEQLRRASHLAEERPDDPVALIALAEATCRYHQALGEGHLDRAIATARKALRLQPALCQALYWEAACQEEAGRHSKALLLYERFVAEAEQKAGLADLVTQASARIRALDTG